MYPPIKVHKVTFRCPNCDSLKISSLGERDVASLEEMWYCGKCGYQEVESSFKRIVEAEGPSPEDKESHARHLLNMFRNEHYNDPDGSYRELALAIDCILPRYIAALRTIEDITQALGRNS